MTVSIRAQIRSGHRKQSMSGSNVGKTSEQTCRIEPTAQDRDGTKDASRVEVPKPQGFRGKRDAKELDNFLWHMERFFKAITLTDEAAKMGDSSKVESLEDIHATGEGDEVSKDHNAHRMGSTKRPNVREGREEGTHYHDRGKGTGRRSTYGLDAATSPHTHGQGHLGKGELDGQEEATLQASKVQESTSIRGLTREGKLGTCGCLEKVLETHREVSRRGNDGDVDDIGGGECHKMLQMTLPMGLYRSWEASRDPWRHLHLATKWKSMETSIEG
ncbi:hypothetical protein AAG906_013158 [Vitis piasezkii]